MRRRLPLHLVVLPYLVCLDLVSPGSLRSAFSVPSIMTPTMTTVPKSPLEWNRFDPVKGVGRQQNLLLHLHLLLPCFVLVWKTHLWCNNFNACIRSMLILWCRWGAPSSLGSIVVFCGFSLYQGHQHHSNSGLGSG